MCPRRILTGLLAASLAVTAAARADAPRAAGDKAPILRLEGGPNTPVTCLTFGPGGPSRTRLYAGGYDKVVHVWDWDEEAQQFKPSAQVYRIPLQPGTAGVINAVAAAPDGRWLAIGCQGVFRREIGFGQRGTIGSAGQLSLADRQDRGLVYVLELEKESGREKGRFVLRRHEAPVRSLFFSPAGVGKGPLLASVSIEPEDQRAPASGRICLWDVEAASLKFRPDVPPDPLGEQVFPGVDRQTCPGVAFAEPAPGQVRVAMAWNDGRLRVWDVAGKKVHEVVDGSLLRRYNNTVAYVPGAGLLSGAVGGEGPGKFGRLQFWEDAPGRDPAPRGQPIVLERTRDVAYLVPVALAAVPGPNKVALAIVRSGSDRDLPQWDYRFRLVDLTTGKVVGRGFGWTWRPLIPLLAVSPTGRHFAVADGERAQVRVYSVDDLKQDRDQPLQTLAGQGDPVQEVGFLRHAGRPAPGLLLRGPGDRATTYVLDGAEKERRLVADPAAHGWQPDGPRIEGRATPARQKGRYRIDWSDEAGRAQPPVTIDLPPQAEEGITAVLVVPVWAGSKHPLRLLAVASVGLTGHPELTLYDAGGRRIRSLVGHSRPIDSLAATADGRFLASASRDRTVSVWSLTDLDEAPAQRGADGVDARTPLLTVFVSALGTDTPEWIAWTPAGLYDRGSPAVEGRVGWHFNPDQFATPVQFAPLKDYAHFFEPLLLEPLLLAGNLPDAVKEIEVRKKRRIPPAQPRAELLKPDNLPRDARGQYLVNEPRVTVGLGVNPELTADQIDYARFVVNGEKEEPVGVAKAAGNRVEKVLEFKQPGVYTVKLTARTRNPDQDAEAAEPLVVRYQPPKPRVTVLGPKAEWMKVPRQPFTFSARVEEAAGPVDVEVFQDANRVFRKQVRAGDPIEVPLQLKPGPNPLRLVATNARPLADYEESERVREERTVVFAEVAPARVKWTRLVYQGLAPDSEEPQERAVPLGPGADGRRPIDLPVRKFVLEAEVTADEDLDKVLLRGQELRLNPANKRVLKVAQEVTLAAMDRAEELTLEATTANTKPTTARVTVRCRPDLPGLDVVDLEPGVYRETADHQPPAIEPRAWWTPAEEFHPFEVLVALNDGKPASVKIDAPPAEDRPLSLGKLTLRPGPNVVRVAIKNGWQERPVRELRATWLRTPIVRDGVTPAKAVRQGNRVETVLTAEVDSPAGLPLTAVRVERGGRKVAEIDPAAVTPRDVGAGVRRWALKVPGIPLEVGENRLTLVVTNRDGDTSRPVRVVSDLNPDVRLPQVVVEKRELPTPNHHPTLAFTVESVGGPLTRVRVLTGRDGPGEEVDLKGRQQAVGPPAGRHWRYDLTHALRLTGDKGNVTIVAENAGGESPLDVTFTYAPPPPRLELDPGQRGTSANPPAPQSRLTLTGRVTWSNEDDEDNVARGREFLQKHLRVFVNDFRQPPPKVLLGAEENRVARFSAEVVLNQNVNDVKFECRGLPLVDSRPVACRKPEKANLYVLVVDVDGMVPRAKLVERVKASLRLPGPGQPFQSSIFKAWSSFSQLGEIREIVPLTRKTANRGGLEARLQLIGKHIARTKSPTDVVLIYWVGPEGTDARGQPVLQWGAGYAVPMAKLLGVNDPDNPEPLGARVLLLDVPARQPGAEGDPRITWAGGHAAIIRYSWANGRNTPALLEAMESVARGGTITLDLIARRAKQQEQDQPPPRRERVHHNLDEINDLARLLIGGGG